MNHNLEIQKILLKVDSINNPEDKINLLKQAINIADANNDLDWGFDLRLDVIYHEKDTSHCIESFPAFTWILSTRDSNPDLFNEEDFLWEYKWMVGAARRNVNITRPQVESIMADLKERMQRNGYTLRAYYNVMTYWHLFLGEKDEARKYLELRDKEQRDRMSNCPACELDTKVEFELMDGNFDKAIALGSDLITKKLTCGCMPFVTFCNLTYYMGKAGDKRAGEYFAKAEEELLEVENDTSLISHVADLIYYLALNDVEKGWQYFEKYADWEVGAEDAVSYDFARQVLPLLKGMGDRNLKLSMKLPYYREDNNYKITELYDYYYAKAYDLAERFDARNGNMNFMNHLKEVIN